MQSALQLAYPPLPLVYRFCAASQQQQQQYGYSDGDYSSGSADVSSISPWNVHAVHVVTPSQTQRTTTTTTHALYTSVRTPLMPMQLPQPHTSSSACTNAAAAASHTLAVQWRVTCLSALHCTHEQLQWLRDGARACGSCAPVFLVVDEQAAVTSAAAATAPLSCTWRRVCVWPGSNDSRAAHVLLPVYVLHADVFVQRTHVAAAMQLDTDDDDDNDSGGGDADGHGGGMCTSSVLYADVCAAARDADAHMRTSDSDTGDSKDKSSTQHRHRMWCNDAWRLEGDAQVCAAEAQHEAALWASSRHAHEAADAHMAAPHAWLPMSWYGDDVSSARARILLLPPRLSSSPSSPLLLSHTLLCRKQWLLTPMSHFLRERHRAIATRCAATRASTQSSNVAQQPRDLSSSGNISSNSNSSTDVMDVLRAMDARIMNNSNVFLPCYDAVTGMPLLRLPRHVADTTQHLVPDTDNTTTTTTTTITTTTTAATATAKSECADAHVSSYTHTSCMHPLCRGRLSGKQCWFAQGDMTTVGLTTTTRNATATTTTSSLSHVTLPQTRRHVGFFAHAMPLWFIDAVTTRQCSQHADTDDNNSEDSNDDDEVSLTARCGEALTRIRQCVSATVAYTHCTPATRTTPSSRVYVLQLRHTPTHDDHASSHHRNDNNSNNNVDAWLQWCAYDTRNVTVNFAFAFDDVIVADADADANDKDVRVKNNNSDDDDVLANTSRVFIDVRAALRVMQLCEAHNDKRSGSDNTQCEQDATRTTMTTTATGEGTHARAKTTSSLWQAYVQHCTHHNNNNSSGNEAATQVCMLHDATHFVAFLVERTRTLQHWPRAAYEDALRRMADHHSDNDNNDSNDDNDNTELTEEASAKATRLRSRRVSKPTAQDKAHEERRDDSDDDLPAVDRRVLRANARLCTRMRLPIRTAAHDVPIHAASTALEAKAAAAAAATAADTTRTSVTHTRKRRTTTTTTPSMCQQLSTQTQHAILHESARQQARHVYMYEDDQDEVDALQRANAQQEHHDNVSDNKEGADNESSSSHYAGDDGNNNDNNIITTIHDMIDAERLEFARQWQPYMRYLHSDTHQPAAYFTLTTSPLSQWLRRYGKATHDADKKATTTARTSMTADDTVPLWDCGVQVLTATYTAKYVNADTVTYANDNDV